MRFMDKFFNKNKTDNPKLSEKNDTSKNHQKNIPLSKNIQDNVKHINKALGQSSDIVVREFIIGEKEKIKTAVIYVDGLVDKNFVQDFILKTLMIDIRQASLELKFIIKKSLYKILRDRSLSVGDMKEISNFQDFYSHILSGDTVILIDGYREAFAVSSKGWKDRSITEPTTETVVRGPKEGFTETLRTNTALIRRKIKDPNLWVETKQIGRRTQTDVAIMYINGIADESIVKEVHTRLDRIDIDGILESAYIEELIQDEVHTPFPTVYNTERPDVIAAGLLEGKVAILIDGTPFVLLIPALFIEFFHASEDFYQRSDIATFIRALRYIAFFLTLLVPSVYIAITTFHQEMLPTALLISLAAQREGIPFPAVFEAFLMEFTFEILREAGIRMPRAVGPAISIVGALVLGEAASQAGIISPAMVIVVSLTAISSFAAPNFSMAIPVRLLRFLFMILAAFIGLYGIALGLMVMVLHLCSLRSFGVPYLSPVAPFNLSGQKDMILRVPIWAMRTRPNSISKKNIYRQQSIEKAQPKPPENNKKV